MLSGNDIRVNADWWQKHVLFNYRVVFVFAACMYWMPIKCVSYQVWTRALWSMRRPDLAVDGRNIFINRLAWARKSLQGCTLLMDNACFSVQTGVWLAISLNSKVHCTQCMKYVSQNSKLCLFPKVQHNGKGLYFSQKYDDAFAILVFQSQNLYQRPVVVNFNDCIFYILTEKVLAMMWCINEM